MANVIKISDQNDLVDAKSFPYAQWTFDKFNPIQSRLIETYDGDTSIAIAAATSGGKAQPLYSKILTPNGFLPMGHIKVGQTVIGNNGNPTQVTGVFPQGKKKIYAVAFSDGAITHCCENHLWNVRTRHDKCHHRPFKTKSLKELINDLRLKDGSHKWSIPLIENDFIGHKSFGENFFTDLPLDPYVLGILLGDGGIKHRVILSSDDEYIIKQAELLLPEGVLIDYLENYDYAITGGMCEEGKARGFKRTNLVKDILQRLELFGLGSCEKFIPWMYLQADPASRLELLQGLMDTDGTANGNNKAAEFTSCSRELALGVCRLARSLGASTSVRIGDTSYVDGNGDRIECEKRYRVTVNLGNINPFRLPRKRDKQKVGLEKGHNRYIDSIEEVGFEECQCISVSALNGLYVTDDYIVTHNTVCAEMYLSYECRKRGGKGLYIAPLKSLARQKEQDWTNPKKRPHHFNDLKTSICTGDFRITAKRAKELEESNIVIMTPEMLASRCRNHSSEKSHFLESAGTIVFDEAHLLTVPSRGDHIEVALMKMVEINPDVRIVLLSATMPNVDEICEWVTKLTGKDTHYLESVYRPVPLNIWYESFYDGDNSYDAREASKVGTAVGLVEYYSDDKFLVFVHTKRTGRLMVDALKRSGVDAEFHNADLDLDSRIRLEDAFAGDKDTRVIVATSTLAWGLNLPARRVIVTGTDRGLSPVENYDIQQMIGRAGRLGLDPQGDAYILVPESQKKETIARIKKPTLIRSTLLEKTANKYYKTLAFHVVSEIHQGSVKTKEGFHKWFSKSLAHHQDHDFNDQVIDDTIELLLRNWAIVVEGGEYRCTAIGKIASMFYYSPLDVSDFRRNFHLLFSDHKEQEDLCAAISVANIDSNRWNIVNRQERAEMDAFKLKVERMYGHGKFTDGTIKAAYAYHNLLLGRKSSAFQALQGTLMSDIDRTMQVLFSLDSMSGKWDKKDWFKTLQLRLRYGVPADLVEIIQIPNVGNVRANRLKAAKIRKVSDFLAYDADQLAKVMKCSKKLAEEALDGARMIELKESL
jgi:replicative superfamily II helicase